MTWAKREKGSLKSSRERERKYIHTVNDPFDEAHVLNTPSFMNNERVEIPLLIIIISSHLDRGKNSIHPEVNHDDEKERETTVEGREET